MMHLTIALNLASILPPKIERRTSAPLCDGIRALNLAFGAFLAARDARRACERRRLFELRDAHEHG